MKLGKEAKWGIRAATILSLVGAGAAAKINTPDAAQVYAERTNSSWQLSRSWMKQIESSARREASKLDPRALRSQTTNALARYRNHEASRLTTARAERKNAPSSAFDPRVLSIGVFTLFDKKRRFTTALVALTTVTVACGLLPLAPPTVATVAPELAPKPTEVVPFGRDEAIQAIKNNLPDFTSQGIKATIDSVTMMPDQGNVGVFSTSTQNAKNGDAIEFFDAHFTLSGKGADGKAADYTGMNWQTPGSTTPRPYLLIPLLDVSSKPTGVYVMEGRQSDGSIAVAGQLTVTKNAQNVARAVIEQNGLSYEFNPPNYIYDAVYRTQNNPDVVMPTATADVLASTTAAPATEVTTQEPATAVPTATIAPTVTEAPSPTPTAVNMEAMPPGVPFQIENYTDTFGKEIVSGTFSSHMVGKLYMDNGAYFASGATSVSPVEFYCQEGTPCVYAHALDGSTARLSAMVDQDLGNRYIQDVYNGKSPGNPIPGWSDILKYSKFGIKFFTSEGNYVYYPSADHAYKVFQVDWNTVKDDARYIQLKGSNSTNWRMMTTMDNKGNLVYVIAVDKPEQLDPTDFAEYFFMGYARVIDTPDQSYNYLRYTQLIAGNVTRLGDWATSKSAPAVKFDNSLQ